MIMGVKKNITVIGKIETVLRRAKFDGLKHFFYAFEKLRLGDLFDMPTVEVNTKNNTFYIVKFSIRESDYELLTSTKEGRFLLECFDEFTTTESTDDF